MANIWDIKSWAGTFITVLFGGFSKAPTIGQLQYAAACIAILSGLITIAYTVYKWYQTTKTK